MRDLVAGLIALVLLVVAILLAATLHFYRQRRERARRTALEQGRTIVAELPTGSDLLYFAADPDAFYYGEQAIDKRRVRAVRVLINGVPIGAYVSRRFPGASVAAPAAFEDRWEGIAQDRWDVAIESETGTVVVECGAIRERISQEIARTIFEAVKADLEARDRRGEQAPA